MCARPASERPPRKRYLVIRAGETGEQSEYDSYDTVAEAFQRAESIAEYWGWAVEVIDCDPAPEPQTWTVRPSGPRAA